jgi:hypothetical protein
MPVSSSNATIITESAWLKAEEAVLHGEMNDGRDHAAD